MKKLTDLITFIGVLLAAMFAACSPLSAQPGSDREPPTNTATQQFDNLCSLRGALTLFTVVSLVAICLGAVAAHYGVAAAVGVFLALTVLCSPAPSRILGIAATKGIDTPEHPGVLVPLKMAAGAKIFAGTIVAINAGGFAVAGSDTAGLVGIGRAEETVDNTTGANGDLSINVRRGVFRWANSTDNPLTQAALGTIVFVEDDNTVAVSTDHAVKAGTVIRIDAEGYWVDTRYHVPTVGTVGDGAVTAAKLANAVADIIPGVSVAIADNEDGTGEVTLQLKDAQGNNLAARGVIKVWFSATAHGAPTDLGDVVAGTGSILAEITTDALILVATDANGLAVLTYTRTGALHAMAEVNGLVATGNATITA
jgi:hypothetical protein